jgi:hypothetical protein
VPKPHRVGPWNVLRRRPNPVSFDLRRDIGIWTGILAILHTISGLTVHLRGRMWMYFLKSLHPLKLQNTQFGFANFTGLGAALLSDAFSYLQRSFAPCVQNAPLEVSPKMDICSFCANSRPWHYLSIDREAPRPLGSRLCIGHGSGCCWSNPWLCPGSTTDEPRTS